MTWEELGYIVLEELEFLSYRFVLDMWFLASMLFMTVWRYTPFGDSVIAYYYEVMIAIQVQEAWIDWVACYPRIRMSEVLRPPSELNPVWRDGPYGAWIFWTIWGILSTGVLDVVEDLFMDI